MDHREFKQIRIGSRIPQYDISKRSGVDRSRLSLFECGHIQLRQEEVAVLKRALRDCLKERAENLAGTLSSVESGLEAKAV